MEKLPPGNIDEAIYAVPERLEPPKVRFENRLTPWIPQPGGVGERCCGHERVRKEIAAFARQGPQHFEASLDGCSGLYCFQFRQQRVQYFGGMIHK